MKFKVGDLIEPKGYPGNIFKITHYYNDNVETPWILPVKVNKKKCMWGEGWCRPEDIQLAQQSINEQVIKKFLGVENED